MSQNGKYLSFSPAEDRFYEVSGAEGLKIWDYQDYNDEDTWFMGNTTRPHLGFTIVLIPANDLEKLR